MPQAGGARTLGKSAGPRVQAGSVQAIQEFIPNGYSLLCQAKLMMAVHSMIPVTPAKARLVAIAVVFPVRPLWPIHLAP